MEKTLVGSQGQVGLVVLLLMSVMLSIGIGAVSKSTRDLQITRQEVEAIQAFNAAEAGIESALLDIEDGNYSSTGTLSGLAENVEVKYQVTEMRQLDMSVLENKPVEVDVSNADNASRLNIEWGFGQSCPNIPGLIVTVYHKAGTNYSFGRYAYNACSDPNNGFDNRFVVSGNGPAGITVSLLSGDQLVRVKPIGDDTEIRVSAAGNWPGGQMPVQYYLVESTARNSESGVTKKIQVSKGLPAAPSLFDYALFSGTSIQK